MYLETIPRRKVDPNKTLTCALSVRLHADDMDFLKKSAEANCRSLADEVRFLVKSARRRAHSTARITASPTTQPSR